MKTKTNVSKQASIVNAGLLDRAKAALREHFDVEDFRDDVILREFEDLRTAQGLGLVYEPTPGIH